jgi:hypothetical protein
VGGFRDFIVIFLGLSNPGLPCWDCSFKFSRLEGFLGLGGFRLVAKIWRSVFPDLLTLLCFAFYLVMVVAEMLGTVDLVEKDTDTVLSGHVMKRRVMWFSKLGFLMLCGLYRLLILCIFVTHTFLLI